MQAGMMEISVTDSPCSQQAHTAGSVNLMKSTVVWQRLSVTPAIMGHGTEEGTSAAIRAACWFRAARDVHPSVTLFTSSGVVMKVTLQLQSVHFDGQIWSASLFVESFRALLPLHSCKTQRESAWSLVSSSNLPLGVKFLGKEWMSLISDQLHAALIGFSWVLSLLTCKVWSASSVGAEVEYSTPGAGIFSPWGQVLWHLFECWGWDSHGAPCWNSVSVFSSLQSVL